MALPENSWRFNVRGSLVRASTGVFVAAFDAIVESGVRDESSPHSLLGVGPITHPDEDGRFSTHYLTRGSPTHIEVPQTVSVFLRSSRGKWDPYVVRIMAEQVTHVSEHECTIELGAVVLRPNQEVFAE